MGSAAAKKREKTQEWQFSGRYRLQRQKIPAKNYKGALYPLTNTRKRLTPFSLCNAFDGIYTYTCVFYYPFIFIRRKFMAVQQNKKSRSRKGMRRSHDRVAIPSVIYCKCGQAKLPHRACPACGDYRGKEYLTVKSNETANE